MFTSSRANQFEYLLKQILFFASLDVPPSDACNMAFFTTAKEFKVKEGTIRDMATRCCKCKTDDFKKSIAELYEDKSDLFKATYYSYLDKTQHPKFDKICKEFETLNYNPEAFNNEQLKIFKRFVKLDEGEKWKIINELKEIKKRKEENE